MPNSFGLLLNQPRITDYRFGGVSSLSKVALVDDGEWDIYLPDFESQRTPKFDTLSCVTFSALNCVETLIYRQFGVRENFSDRYTATVSGTTEDGNYAYRVADSIRNDGLVEEAVWPLSSDVSSQLDYLAPVPALIKNGAKEIYTKYRFSYEFVYPKDFLECLRYAPLQVAMHAYGVERNGIFQRTSADVNHMVELYGAVVGDHYKIYDHYDRKFKKLSWDYNLPFAVRWNVERPNQSIMDIPNNHLLQLTEGQGGFAMSLDGKKVIDDLAKVQASFIMRNNGDIAGKTTPLTQEQWDGLETINLKREPV